MPKLAALASAANNICFASSSVRLVYVRGMSPHLNMDMILNGLFLWPGATRLHLERLRFCAFFVSAACVESWGPSSRPLNLAVLDPDGLRVYKGVRTEV